MHCFLKFILTWLKSKKIDRFLSCQIDLVVLLQNNQFIFFKIKVSYFCGFWGDNLNYIYFMGGGYVDL